MFWRYFGLSVLALVLYAANSANSVNPVTAALAQSALLRFDGLDIDTSEFSPALRNRLFEIQLEYYQQLQTVLDQVALERFIEEEAARRQQSQDAVKQALFAVQPATEDEIKAFYEHNKGRIRESFAEVKDRIGPFLATQRRQALERQWVARLRSEGRYRLLLQPPQAPYVEINTDGFPGKGPQQAKVTVVEFADYRCSHCINAYPEVQKVMARYAGQARLVFMDLPVIRPQQVSARLARGGACAAEQGRFWGYHDLAFEQQGDLDADSALVLATELELDLAAFQTCLDSEQAKAKLARSQAEAERLGVTGTPTFFVNGQKLVVDDLVQGLDQAIASALRQPQSSH